MLVYLTRRLLLMIPMLFAATLVCFGLVDTTGDPVQSQIFAIESSTGEPVPPEVEEAMRAELYHDRSSVERYWVWLTGIGGNGDIGLLQGKWGPSVQGSGHDIGEEIGDRLVVTLRLVLIAIVMSTGLAIVTGVVSAVKQYSRTDYLLTFIGFLALAMPTFWLAELLKQGGVAFNNSVGSTVFYTFGASSPDTRSFSLWESFTDSAGHLILPTLALMLTGYAAISRYQRAAMLEVLNSDYVRLARAKGVRNRTVMRRHALRTALIPIATFAPLAAAFSMGGSIVIEQVFGWRGLGMYFITALRDTDSFAIMAYLLISGILVLFAVLISDLLYGVLDPRIRYE